MKLICLALTILISSQIELHAQSVFIPENGNYEYDLNDVTGVLKAKGINYVTLKTKAFNPGLKYKLNSKRNEFQIKNWFQQDWYVMQDMFSLDSEAYMRSQKATTFNDAKRRQYSRFAFDKKAFFHYKTMPAMKEWGGLTHPPVKRLVMPLHKYDSSFVNLDYSKLVSPYFSPILQLELDKLSRSELTFGNKVVAMVDRDVFIAKKKLIRNARESILMSSLVFICDKSTREVTNLLIQKHREGVNVKIIADGMIGKVLKERECLLLMSGAGIEVIETKDFWKHKLKAIYHTKTLVVDFKEAIAGGHNMIDADNFSRSTDFNNRDVDLYVKGPMVTDIAKQFVENWRYQTTLNKNFSPLVGFENVVKVKLIEERKLGQRGDEFYNRILSNVKTRMNGVCRFIKQAPYEDRHTIGKAYLKLLNRVSRHLVITDPVKSDTYIGKMSDAPITEKLDNFDMFNQLHLKVQALAKAGRKIDYLTTNINMAGNENVAILNETIREQLDLGKELMANWSLVKLMASNSYYGKPHYKNLMTDWLPYPNVHIWKHMSFQHSKIFYFDRVVASIGSYNFQHNATDQAYESTAICMDESLNKGLDQLLVEDMANSIPLIFSGLR